MKILPNNQESGEWLLNRLGKITGSRLADIIVKRGTSKKIGFYEVIAERLSVTEETEYDNEMQRGHSLEQEAVDMFSKSQGVKVESVGLCVSDFNEHIAVSPDGLIEMDGKYKAAVEVKCLSSAKHLKALIDQEIPSEHEAQVIQYFIVNEDLEMLYFVFYDPRLPCVPLHHLTVFRVDIEEKIKEYREYEEKTLDEIDNIIRDLTF